MSKDITPRGHANLPASLQEHLSQEIESIQKRIAAPSGDRIKASGGKFVTPAGDEGESLHAVVLDFVSQNLWYDVPYQKDNPAPPACFAIGLEPLALAPSDNSPNKQSETCGPCQHNQFGSAVTGRGKACRNSRLLALCPAIEAVNEDPNSPIWTLQVPPTSLKVWDAYVGALAARLRLPAFGVVTRISLDPTVDYAAPRFETVRQLSQAEMEMYFERRTEARTRLLTEPDVSQYTPPAPKRQPPAGVRGGGRAAR